MAGYAPDVATHGGLGIGVQMGKGKEGCHAQGRRRLDLDCDADVKGMEVKPRRNPANERVLSCLVSEGCQYDW